MHLMLMKAENLSNGLMGVNLGLFVVTFFVFRLMICPYLWWVTVRATLFGDGGAEEEVGMECLPWHFKYFWFVMGMIFNGLNSYWGFKIILKVMRKVSGKEKMKESNGLKDS